MKLPKLQASEKYVGLYVFDFGDHAGVGFTAEEVAELLESEKYKDSKPYKIHKAYPDGTIELKGVSPDIFQLEAGMFFYSQDLDACGDNFQRLIDIAVSTAPPCRAKVHLTKYSEQKFVLALIYPAEFDDEISRWLIDTEYRTEGSAQGGINAVEQYYASQTEILKRHQLFAKSSWQNRTGIELLANVKAVMQR